MKIEFHKYHGTGNDFILIDDREEQIDTGDTQGIRNLCERRFGIGADGLILLRNHSDGDFEMVYFNSDGRESSMCGNGGRCILGFAKKLGLIDREARFKAIDGWHRGKLPDEGIASLEMQLVKAPEEQAPEQVHVDTGSPHWVWFRDIQEAEFVHAAHAVRHSARFEEEGINVNFVKRLRDGKLQVRTYERGVEAETYSCGTGVVAAALAAHEQSDDKMRNTYVVETKGGLLSVSFQYLEGSYQNIWLTGPFTHVFEGFTHWPSK